MTRHRRQMHASFIDFNQVPLTPAPGVFGGFRGVRQRRREVGLIWNCTDIVMGRSCRHDAGQGLRRKRRSWKSLDARTRKTPPAEADGVVPMVVENRSPYFRQPFPSVSTACAAGRRRRAGQHGHQHHEHNKRFLHLVNSSIAMTRRRFPTRKCAEFKIQRKRHTSSPCAARKAAEEDV